MGRYVGLTHNRHIKAGSVSSNILRTTEYESATGITTDSDNNVTEITLGENKYEEVIYNNVGLITSYIENIDGNSITYNILYDAAGIVTSIQEYVPPVPTYTIAGIPTSISEGSTGIVTVQVTGRNPSDVLYWDITNPGDFTTSSGNFSLDSNLQGTISIGPLADQLTEGPETFVVRVRTGSTAGAIVTTSDPITINDTSNTPTFTLTPPSSIDEGSAGLITCTTTDIFDGTTLYWDVVPTTDFTVSNGSVTVNSNSANIYVTPDNDQTTEGPETFQLKLYTDSARTVNVATSSSITINDSSQTPAYAFSNVPSSMNEGDTINLTVTTTNTPGGTALYWDIAGGSGVNSNDFAVYQGSITVNNNTSVVQITTTNDNSSEGTETFQVRLFTDSGRTNQVAITNSITINDTSINPLDGDQVFTSAGTFTVPSGVTKLAIYAVGGGGGGAYDSGGLTEAGGGGGGVAWLNDISVTSGQQFVVSIGQGGIGAGTGGQGTGGGSSGGNTVVYAPNGSPCLTATGGGGGYSGGGAQGTGTVNQTLGSSSYGTASGGHGDAQNPNYGWQQAGVSCGTGPRAGRDYYFSGEPGGGGTSLYSNQTGQSGTSGGSPGGNGGNYGGGGAVGNMTGGGQGAPGAVRFIWPGDTGNFPNNAPTYP